MCDSHDLRNELSAPADMSPEGVSRRRFLQYTLAGTAVAGTGVSMGFNNAFGASSAGAGDRILVLVELFGGNDGLNTVAPVDSGRYRDLRGGIAVTPAEGLSIGNGLALHPKLPYLKSRYDGGDLAIVQGIGYADSTLSHFDSMAHWMGGEHGVEVGRRPKTGWIGRYVDGLGAGLHPLHTVAFDTSIPLHMRGEVSKAVTMRTGALPEFGTEMGSSWRRMYDAVRRMDTASNPNGPWASSLARAGSQALDIAADLIPAYVNPMPSDAFQHEMIQAARLINVDVGVRIVTVQATGFDNHGQHKWDHAVALENLDKGIEKFYRELDARLADQVTVMTFSEFGRRPQKNASGGTDHGAASLAFVVGKAVSGGLHGEYPSLTNLDRRGNLAPTVDFRDLYGTVAESWLGADGAEVVGGNYNGLALFGAAPDGRLATPAPTPVPVAPPRNVVNKPAPAPIARHGYLVLTDSGQVHNFGKHATYGSATGGGAVSVRRHPTVDGYWVAASDGAVNAFGEAPHHGAVDHLSLNSPIISMTPQPKGGGYWLASADGGIFALGSAGFHGSAGGIALAAPVVGMAAHPSGQGYWMCGADGGVFAFGGAPFHGSAGNLRLAAPIVAIAGHPSGRGYWLLAADGGVFAFGAAGFHGALGGLRLAAPVVDMTSTSTGKGYWLVGRDGGVFTFGDASFHGAPTESGAIDPVVSITS